MSAPTDLQQLSHGRGQLRPAPAASIWRIDVALGRPVDINRAYASWDQQMVYYRAWNAYASNPIAWRRTHPGQAPPPLALHPDQSWHCKGMAVDTDESPRTVPALASLWSDNGWRFEVASEPWHGQYYTSLDRNYGKPAGGSSVPFPTPDPPDEMEDDEMKNSAVFYTRSRDNQTVYLAFNTGSGWWMEWLSSPAIIPAGNNAIAATLGTGSFAQVGEAYATELKRTLDRMA